MSNVKGDDLIWPLLYVELPYLGVQAVSPAGSRLPTVGTPGATPSPKSGAGTWLHIIKEFSHMSTTMIILLLYRIQYYYNSLLHSKSMPQSVHSTTLNISAPGRARGLNFLYAVHNYKA